MEWWWTRRSSAGDADDEWSDARPAPEAERAVLHDPDLPRRLRRRRRAATSVLGILFAAGLVIATVGQGGFRDLSERRSERDALLADIAEREQRLLEARDQVERLGTDPMARERIAREELDLVKPGEVNFLLSP